MRSVKQKLSLVLVLALLVNILLPGMGAFAAETNNFVVPGSGEQTLISPDTSNWGNQTSTPQSNGNSSSQVNSNKEEAVANQILDSINNQQLEIDREGQVLPLLASITFRFGAQYVVRTLIVSRLVLTSHFTIRACQRNITSSQIQNAIDRGGTKYIDRSGNGRAIYDSSQNIMLVWVRQGWSNKWILDTVYKPDIPGKLPKQWTKADWPW